MKRKLKNLEKTDWFRKNCNVGLLSLNFGLSEKDVIELFCNDDYTFNKLQNLFTIQNQIEQTFGMEENPNTI
jgi:hypothetical protein